MEANDVDLANVKASVAESCLKTMRRAVCCKGGLRIAVLRATILIALAPGIGACTSSPSTDRSYNEDKLSQLVAHQTTYSEAQQLLGPPQRVKREADGSMEATWSTGMGQPQNGFSGQLLSHAGGLAQMAGMFSKIPMAGAVIGGLTSFAGSGLGDLRSNGTSDARQVGTATLTFNGAGVLESWTSTSGAAIG